MTAPLEGESSAADVVVIVMVSGDGRRQLVGDACGRPQR